MAELELAERLAERLDRRPRVEGAELVGWRFDLRTGWTLRAGLKNGLLGGPYEPPSASHHTSGSLYLRWSDDQVSRGPFNARIVDELDEHLVEWRLNAYHDPDAPEILPPAPLPEVETADPAVEALVDAESEPRLDWLHQVRGRLGAAGLNRLQADCDASRGWRQVYSSSGLRVCYAATSCSFGASAEELYWRSYGKRRLPLAAELEELLEDVATVTPVLRETVEPPEGEIPVLLSPGVAMGLLGTFLVSNLQGATILAGRSAYTLGDFHAGRQVARPDLHLAVDSLLDLEGAASPISAQGLPGGRAVLIEGGRLARPTVDLKYSRRSGFPPTPVPAGSPSFLYWSDRPPAALAAIQSGILAGLRIHSVLGLHTNDSTSGRYSLVAPQAQVLRAGRLQGRAKVALRGSLFEHLLDERTALVSFPWGRNPGLLFWSEVEARR